MAENTSDSEFHIASAYAQLFLRSSQLPAATLLRETGLDEESLAAREYLDLGTMQRIMHCIDAQIDDAAWAARTGAILSSATHGPMGFAALSAPTLGEAMQVMAEFHPVRINTFHVELHKNARFTEMLMFDADIEDDKFVRWISESVMKVFESLIETILGHPPGALLHIQFRHARPHYADVLPSIYSANLTYGADRTALIVPASWWDIRSPLANSDSYRSNIAQCRGLLADLAREKSATALVEHLIAQHFEQMLAGTAFSDMPPSLSELAKGLFITPRTLIRRLGAENNSYRAILELCRRRYAQQLLKGTQLSVADIAIVLGYRESANFGRAFRQWFGCAPGVWRRKAN
jgi:AraC-like DNA-binding protein